MSDDTSARITAEERPQVDGGRLTDDIGISEQDIEWWKRFTRLESDDINRRTSMSDTFEAVSADFVDEFYAPLQPHSEAISVVDSSSKRSVTVSTTEESHQ